MKLAFQIIVITFLILIGIFIILSSPPDSHSDKIYIKMDNKDRPCFYVDNMEFFSPFKNYNMLQLLIDDINMTQDNGVIWGFPNDNLMPKKSDFLISSFYGSENCISYGDNKNIKGIRNAKPLLENIKYVAMIFSNNGTGASASFSTIFKLHKNESTGKTEVEILDN
jgi:hypothetical protein